MFTCCLRVLVWSVVDVLHFSFCAPFSIFTRNVSGEYHSLDLFTDTALLTALLRHNGVKLCRANDLVLHTPPIAQTGSETPERHQHNSTGTIHGHEFATRFLFKCANWPSLRSSPLCTVSLANRYRLIHLVLVSQGVKSDET